MGLKAIYISPNGVTTPMLFDTFKETFEANGILETNDFNEADIAFIDLYSNVVPIDGIIIDILKLRGIPLVMFENTDFGAMSKEVFNENDYLWGNNKTILFLRKYDKTKQYPSWVHPYELVLYDDCLFQTASLDELSKRPYDICWVGNMSPTRVNAMNGLLLSGKFNIDFHWTNVDKKLPHNEWLDKHRNAKLFLSACGGGFGDERPHQLMTISPMLRVSNNQLIVHNFRHGIDCIEISEHPTEQEINYLHQVLNDKFLLYDIYQNGMKRLKKYFNQNYRANYILEILKESGINVN